MASIISAGTTSGTSLNLSGDTSGVLQLATNGSTTAITVDTSQNVGIGTASPSSRLDIGNPSDSNQSLQFSFPDANTARINSTRKGSGSLQNIQILGQSTAQFYTDGTERMRITSSGRVGIGTSSPSQKFVVYDATGGDNIIMATQGNAASMFMQASGTGDVGTFNNYPVRLLQNNTERVRIDTSGNIGIGTTSPLTNLQVVGSGSGTFSPYNDPFIVQASAGGYTYMQLVGVNNQAGIIYNRNGSTGWFAGLDNNGNLKYSYMSAMNGTALGNAKDSSTPALMLTSNQILVNQASGSSANEVFGAGTTADATAACFRSTNTGQTSDVTIVRANRNTTNGSYRALSYYNDAAGAYRFWVLDSGNCQNTNGSYGAFSDIKLKENIVDASPKLEKLNQVRVVNYNLKGDDLKQIGVVAQELEQVFPSMVENIADRDADGNDLGTTTKSVKYSVFVPMLIKAIQELKAELDATKAEVAALKGVN